MKFGAKGPNFAPLSACSSAADAIGIASNLLHSGSADIVITGGTEAAICPIGIAGFNACKALSKRNDDPEKASRPFDLNRDGFVMGEGASILVMETIKSANARNVDILSEFAGYGSTADAFHLTQPALEGRGAAAAMQIALANANLKPSQIDYINAHGTSTKLNDSRETEAMKLVFGSDAELIPISSTKSMTGHLLGASGALEAAISILSIINGVLPPTINLETPDPDCDLDYIPYVPRRGKVRTAMSNSFGFGGHNASLIFKEII
jgi:3-oxoacyl-[acyl-carrier-protein] synthase II